MYKIIGADQKEYGPISADQIRQWIAEGRVNGQTQACAEGTQDWKPLAAFPEFSFTGSPVAGAPPMPKDGGVPAPIEDVLARDYSIDIMSCISRAWRLLMENFGTVFVTFLLSAVLIIGASFVIGLILNGAGVGHLPFAKQIYFRPISIIFTTLIIGPLTGGVYYVYLSLLRGEFAGAGEIFTGFQSFQDLFLVKLIPSLIGFACVLPYSIATAAKLGPFLDKLKDHQNPGAMDPREFFSTFISGYTSSLPLLIICLIPTTYLTVNWIFTMPLVIDRKMGFWSALVISWKIVHKHWFHIFGLVVLTGLINVAGGLMCCVGLLVTVPFSMLAICFAYEDIFGRKTT